MIPKLSLESKVNFRYYEIVLSCTYITRLSRAVHVLSDCLELYMYYEIVSSSTGITRLSRAVQVYQDKRHKFQMKVS